MPSDEEVAHPSQVELLLNTPLYELVDFSSLDEEAYRKYLVQLERPTTGIDFYCKECKKDRLFLVNNSSPFPFQGDDAVENHKNQLEQQEKYLEGLKTKTFSGAAHSQSKQRAANKQQIINTQDYISRLRKQEEDAFLTDRFIVIKFSCQSDPHNHQAMFVLQKQERSLIKIGQFPSFADIQIADSKKYSKLLPQPTYKELVRGIGLSSHGVGIGSFVYIRRVFEYLLNDAYKRAKTQKDWDEKSYENSRVNEKIKLLNRELPDFLVENAEVYSILSKGVHELDEDECLHYFPAIYAAIQAILDEELEREARRQSRDQAKKAIQQVKQNLAK